MKKVIIAFLVCFAPLQSLFAEPPVSGSAVVSDLIQHVHAQVIQDTKGRTRLELTDSVLRMFPYKGNWLIEGQAGWSGTTTPGKGEPIYQHMVVSAFFPVNPYLKNMIDFTPDYAILKGLEFGPVYGYDLYEHHGYLGVQGNLAFGLDTVVQP